MKKLLLTSAGFTNPKVGEVFVGLLDKPVDQINILFVPTASRTEPELLYVKKSEEELMRVGVAAGHISWLDIDNLPSDTSLNNFHVVYVCGGNTFYLMHKLNESGFGRKIKEMVNGGKIYVGASAGSVVAGPDVSIAGPGDKNDIGLKDMAGLGLTDVVTSPHYNEMEEAGQVEKFRAELPHKIIPLTDAQALEIVGDSIKLIE